jgi:capsular polysaccharide biosynthesis protein
MDQLPAGQTEGPGLTASVWHYRWLVGLALVIGILGAWAFSSLQPVRYEATSVILLKDPAAGQLFQDSPQSIDSNRYVGNQAAFIASPPVLDRAARLAGGRISGKELLRRMDAKPSKDLDVITIRIHDSTARGAAKLANAIALSYQQVVVNQTRTGATRDIRELEATAAVLRDSLEALQDRIRTDPSDLALRAERVAVTNQLTRVVEQTQELAVQSKVADPVELRVPAELPDQPVQPRPRILMAGGALLGFAVGAGLAWRLNWRRQAGEQGVALPGATEGAERALSRPHRGTFLWQVRRPRDAAVSSNGSYDDNGRKDNVMITDFEEITASAQQLVSALEGPRQLLYEEDIPQLVAEELAHRFPVDLVVVLLKSDSAEQVTRSAGIGADELNTSNDRLHDLMEDAMRNGPSLVGDDERDRLAASLLGGQTRSLALVPIVHDHAGFGVLLAGQRNGTEQPAPLDDRAAEDIATFARYMMPYLHAWLLLRNLRLRLEPLSERTN